ncbi:MAG: hypothetical protein AAF236_02620 [Verrucomicrobiota bacterium]
MKSLDYLSANSTQSLREGIAELRIAEGAENDAAEHLAPELLDDIDIHDAIHVLFACPTDLRGEIIAHIWTAFGTTVSMADMHRVNAHRDHREVLRQIGHRKLIATWLRSIPTIGKTLLRARRMKAKWPVEEMDQFLDRPLNELRSDFGIRVIPFDEGSGRSGGAALRKQINAAGA